MSKDEVRWWINPDWTVNQDRWGRTVFKWMPLEEVEVIDEVTCDGV